MGRDDLTFHDLRHTAATLAAQNGATTAELMGATQRPVTEQALTEGLQNDPAWRTRPSSFVYGDQDRNIPVAALQFMAERTDPAAVQVVEGGSHALPVSQPERIAAAIATAAGA